jgi:hypothetical protein
MWRDGMENHYHLPINLTTQRGYATRWARDNHVRIYKDPAQPNPTYANRVLYGDVIEALGNEDGAQ